MADKAAYDALMGEMSQLDVEVKKHEAALPAGEDTADEADGDDDGDDMGAKLAGWEKRKEKYKKYIDKGKVEKLQKACDKQKAKLEKAKVYASLPPPSQPCHPTSVRHPTRPPRRVAARSPRASPRRTSRTRRPRSSGRRRPLRPLSWSPS